MATVFVDTGAWIALLKRDDHKHQDAFTHYQRRSSAGARLVTTNYVTDETITRLRYDSGLDAARGFRAALERARRERRARVVWVDERTEQAAWEILDRFADLPLSFTDATSAAVARAVKATEVFGFDRHFRALGFDLQPA